MKQKSRLQLKRNLALLLVLSMLFGLSTAAYATEEAGLPEASAAGEVVSDEAYQAEEVLPEAEVTTDTASDEAMNAEDVIADGAMNTESENKTSLSGGSIDISLNTAGMHPVEGKLLPNPETISYKYDSQVYADREDLANQFSDGRKYLGDSAKIEYSVVDNSKVLEKDKDYTEDYYYTVSDFDTEEVVAEPIGDKTVLDREGFVTVSINGIGAYVGNINLCYIVERKLISISEDSVSLNVTKDSVTVTNLTEETLYVYAVSSNDLTEADRNDNIGDYIEIRSKESTVLRQAYSKKAQTVSDDTEDNWEELPLKEGVKYELAVYPDKIFTPNEGKSQLFTFIPISDSDITTIDLGGMINFKATINKSTQKISLSWKPGNDKAYKSYKLKRLNADNETFDLIDGWGDKLLTKKSFKYKTVEKGDSPAVFLLECYKRGSTVPDGQYITVASPVLYYVTTALEPKDAEYCFSKLYGGDRLSYTVEMNLNKKFDNDSGRDYYTIRSEECFDSGFYPIKKTLSADTVMTTFNSHFETENKPGTVFYHQVTAHYEYKGVSFSSEPSNVVSRKAGPQKVDVFNINGVKDLSIMNAYLTEMMADDEYSGFPECSTISQGFVHKYDEGPDKKHGYVVFVAPKQDNLKAYDLLMADSANGSYKKLKTYKLDSKGEPAKNSGLYKWDYRGASVSGDAYKWLWDDDVQVYYARYNKFYPNETKYYAVRAVDKKNNAGGLSDGYECTAELDDVWDACAFRTNKDKNISLYWTHDDSAAYYRIYRTETDINNDDFDIDLQKTLIATVKNKKAGTLDRVKPKQSEKELVDYLNATVSGGEIRDTEFEGPYNKYVDKKGLEAGKYYDYVIEPVLEKDGDMDDTIDKAGFASTYDYGEELDSVKTAAYMSLFGKSTKTKKKTTRLNVYIKSCSVKTTKNGLAQLSWQPSDKKLSGGLKYRIEYCIITGNSTKNVKWYNIQGNGPGNWTWRTDWTDNATLRRGYIKKYRITPMYPIAGDKVLLGKTKVIGQVAFADKIELKVGKSTIKKGGSTTIKVYPKRTQNPRGVAYKDIVVTLEDEADSLFKVDKKYVSKGGYWLITVKSKGKPGTGRIRMTSASNSHATGTVPSQKVDMKVVK